VETNDYPIGELEERTGVPRRTIYFYVQQGVLPPPTGAGLAARYHPSHVLRLQAIPRLRGIGWRLDQIREFFERASDADIRAIVEAREAGADTVPSAPRPESPVPSPAPARPTLIARYTLAPGVELLVRQDLPAPLARAVRRLLDAASAIFDYADLDANRDDRPTECSANHPTSSVSPESST
jgi:DNA-binding transcriptional MerR regulator